MNNRNRIKDSLNFIEENILEKISLKDIAKTASFSEYHFHRMFKAITGYKVKSYIRKRRLFLAAVDILNKEDSLAGIAMKYHFESQQSFSVAFKQMHDISPGLIWKENKPFKSFGRMIISDTERDRPKGIEKEPTKEIVNPINIIGVSADTRQADSDSGNNSLSGVWSHFNSKSHLITNATDENSIFSIYTYDPGDILKEDISYNYMVGLEVNDLSKVPEGMIGRTVPKSCYLIFEHNNKTGSLTDTYSYIDEYWIPNSDYELSINPDFEIHKKDIDLVKIYISIKKHQI